MKKEKLLGQGKCIEQKMFVSKKKNGATTLKMLFVEN